MVLGTGKKDAQGETSTQPEDDDCGGLDLLQHASSRVTITITCAVTMTRAFTRHVNFNDRRRGRTRTHSAVRIACTLYRVRPQQPIFCATDTFTTVTILAWVFPHK